jgi:hypothetical protein
LLVALVSWLLPGLLLPGCSLAVRVHVPETLLLPAGYLVISPGGGQEVIRQEAHGSHQYDRQYIFDSLTEA